MRLAVVLPTITGREESLQETLSAYRDTLPPRQPNFWYDILVVKDEETCGEAWLQGLEWANNLAFDYIHFTADDIIPHQGWFEAAEYVISLGCIPAPKILNTDGTLQTNGGTTQKHDWVELSEIAPFSYVEFTNIPFLSVDLMAKIGMPPIHYSSDIWISYVAWEQYDVATVFSPAYLFTHHRSPIGRGGSTGSEHRRGDIDRVLFRSHWNSRFSQSGLSRPMPSGVADLPPRS